MPLCQKTRKAADAFPAKCVRPMLVAVAIACAAAADTVRQAAGDAEADPGGRLARRSLLVKELIGEAAYAEARAEACRLLRDFPGIQAPPHVCMASGSFDGLSRAFLVAEDPLVFRISGCALDILFGRDPELAAANPDLAWQVALASGSWSRRDFDDAAGLVGMAPAGEEGKTGGGIGGWLSRRVVGFYRLFVGPAIGNRCALEPSCSAYFTEASRRHGILGVPMTADRFVREPVASAPGRPLVRNPAGLWRHPDPVSDHDWWFESEDVDVPK